MTAVQDLAPPAARGMTLTLEVCEELDVASVTRLREQLEEALAVRPGAVVVDLRRCAFLDAQALPPLLDAHRAARRLQVSFALRGLTPQAERLLALAGLQDVFTMADA